MVSIGVVLGAGGVVGEAFHVGAMAAVAEGTGWDPRTADLLVGTSAGATTAALLRSGLSAGDRLARLVAAPVSAEGQVLAADTPAYLGQLQQPEPRGRSVGVPLAPWLAVRAFLRRGPVRPGLAVAGLLPVGRGSTAFIGDPVRATQTGPWPEAPTWIVAVKVVNGRRVVLGRDDVEVADLGQAVEASSAVPGRFAPTRLPGGRHLDGGVWSANNADLVAGLAFDAVVVSAPMAGGPSPADGSPSLGLRVRQHVSRQLAREVGAVRRRGVPTLVITPGPDDLEVMAGDGPTAELVAAVARQARHSVLDLLAQPASRPVVRLLEQAAQAADPA